LNVSVVSRSDLAFDDDADVVGVDVDVDEAGVQMLGHADVQHHVPRLLGLVERKLPLPLVALPDFAL